MKVHEKQADYLVVPNMDSAVFKAARLGDVTESMRNGLYKPAGEYGDDGVPSLRMYNIDAGKIVWRDIKRMRVSASELEDYGLIEGDLLVNRVNSRELVGKTALIPPGMGPSVFESKNIRLRLRTDQALPKFINYQLLAFGRQHFSNNAQQVVGMASVSQKQLADFPIVLAPLDQQERIVAEIEKQFSRLDEAVANLKRVKANLKRYKAAILKAAVEGRLVETEAERARREGRSYETGAQLLQRILETRRSQWKGKGKYKEPATPDTTDLPELPEGWVWATVDQISSRVQYGYTAPSIARQHGIRFLRITDIQDNRVDWPNVPSCEISETEKRELLLKSGDIVFARTGATVGKSFQLKAPFPESVFASYLIRISPHNLPISDWLKVFFQSAAYWSQIRESQAGIGQPNVNGTKLQALILPVPPLEEQDQIVAEAGRCLSLAEETEAQVNANLKRTENLRQSVLRRSFCP